MSLSSSTSRNDYTGNGSVSSYSYNFKVFLATDLLVTVADTSSPPVQTLLVLNTDYTVSGAGSINGGSVVLVNSSQSWLSGGNLKTGYHLTIRRVRPLTQITDIRNQGAFFPEVHEDSFDHFVMIDQQQEDLIDRSCKNPETLPSSSFDPTLPTNINQAGIALITNSGGNGFAAGPSASQISSANSDALAAAASATAAAASATAAATSETNAASSATAAAGSAAAAAASATAAATSETNAASSATAAAASAAAASGSATSSATSATNSANSAAAAATSASGASTSATNAANSATAAQAAAAASGGGGGSLRWIEASTSPTPEVDNLSSGVPVEVYAFQSGLSQSLYAVIKVSHGYVAGNPINLKTDFYSPDSSGTALIQAVSTLVRQGTDAMSSTTNQHTSTNSAATLGAGTVSIPQGVVMDLSDGSGHINGVAVSAGDLILVQLTRGSDTASSDLKVPVYGAEVTIT